MTRTAGLALFILPLLGPSTGQAQDPAELTGQGDSALAAGDTRKAIGLYTKAIAADDASLAAYEGRARAYFELEQLDRFVLDVDRVLRMDTASFTGHLLKATYAFRGEDMNTAEHHAARAERHARTALERGEALLIKGQAKAAFNQVDAAVADLEAGLGQGADDNGATATLARLYDTQGRHADALALLEVLCEKEPRNIAHWSNRGHELNQLERYDEAVTVLGTALKLDKDEPIVLNNRALALLALGRHKEALRDADRSLRSLPGNGHTLRTRALVRVQLGDRERACRDLAAAKSVGGVADVDELIATHCIGPN
ncbi:MAG: tetratricopeptide repeat protein [Flavobacteriales bacterium]|jgi:tetratricopeptide (TPR) repeat protein|nr:tetratricopeptide repeat protein [Flavobacteriales bacterium]